MDVPESDGLSFTGPASVCLFCPSRVGCRAERAARGLAVRVGQNASAGGLPLWAEDESKRREAAQATPF